MKKKLIIVVAPSGAGKSTFLQRLLDECPNFGTTTTYTSRKMRRGESEGNPYHFIAKEKFEELISQDFFVEWARVHENFYGSSIQQIEEIWNQDKHVIMDIDVQGADTFKVKFPDAYIIFIMPPSIDELRRRVIDRDGKVPDDLELRMSNAAKEMARADDFDAQVINDDFEQSYARFKKIVEDHVQSQ